MQTYLNCLPCLMASIVKAHFKEERNNILAMLMVARMEINGFKLKQDLYVKTCNKVSQEWLETDLNVSNLPLFLPWGKRGSQDRLPVLLVL